MGILNMPDTPAGQASARARYAILTDFDGTITLADTTEALFARFADPSWIELEAAWAGGEITTEDQLCASYQTIVASRDEIDRFLDQMPIDGREPLEQARGSGRPGSVSNACGALQ